MARRNKRAKKHAPRTSWDPVADWYDGWMGEGGSEHHRHLAIPAVLELLDPRPGEEILDVGAGQGVLAAPIAEAQASYTGVDLSERLLRRARKHHGRRGRFIRGDARCLAEVPGLREGGFDAVVFLLSIQNMDPLQPVLKSAAWALKGGGRLVMLLTHPCFRVPRQSGADCGLVVDCIKEIPTHKVCASGPRARAKNAANREVPLFLGLRALKTA
jgi:ubiquinone/menaquinone biosynthesis C-methylase UbiE